MSGQKISEFVNVVPRYLRSVNLSLDGNRTESCDGYIVTENSAQALERICSGLLENNGQRAFTLIGPYGTGKSAFAVFLSQLLSAENSVAKRTIKLVTSVHSALGKQVELVRTAGGKHKGFLVTAITARRRPISQLILEALAQSVLNLKRTVKIQKLVDRIQKAIDDDYWKDTATVLQFLGEIGEEAKSQGFSGHALLVDEAGKTLEYALQDRIGGDVYVFQQISEYASREQDFPVLFLITLHQMFDDYVELAERTVRAEWTKVQERFQTIQFAESAATTIRLLAQALEPVGKRPVSVEKAISVALKKLGKSTAPLPIGLDEEAFQVLARQAWPLHPTVLLAMPHLFRRLAQNERSVFSYLTSLEPFGFQKHLQESIGEDGGFIRLHKLYAYLLSNFEAGLARLPHAKKLLEANDVINSRQKLSPLDYDLIRIVAILNVLGEMCPLRATLKFLKCAVSEGSSVEQRLLKLKQQSILTFRQLDGSYRVWEGSDVDIEVQMSEARRHLQMAEGSFLNTLRKHLPQRLLVAKRHSLETGAHRFFKVSYSDRIEKPDLYLKMGYDDGESGIVLVVLPQSDSTTLKKKAKEATLAQKRLIIALPQQIDALRHVVEEVACLRWVQENTEELRDDRVARRELSLRMVEGEQKIASLLQTLFDPRPAPVGNLCKWFWNGTDQDPGTPVGVSRLLSRACDEIFPKTAYLRNELVARRSISSAAASARRSLMESMLQNGEKERLGIEKYPPERSIYESVLHTTGLHDLNKAKGTWSFQEAPADNPSNLRPCWELMEKEIFSDQVKHTEVKDIFELLADPPFGLPEGIHPILFTAFYLVNRDELFLYRDNSFIPDPQPAHFELLQRRPDLFSVSGARLDGIRKAVVQRLATGLHVPVRIASVVRALFRFINALPPVTLKSTKFIDSVVMKMCQCFLNATSPEKLLFVDLPTCYGLAPFSQNEIRTQDINYFFKQLNFSLSTLNEYAESLLTRMRNQLLKKCGLLPDDTGWMELERRAVWLAPRVNHEILTPFLNAVINGRANGHTPKPALSLVANKPFDQWSDMDIERFPGLADGVSELFIRLWGHLGDEGEPLSEKELEEKQKLKEILRPQFQDIEKKVSPKVLEAALKELIMGLKKHTDYNISGGDIHE